MAYTTLQEEFDSFLELGSTSNSVRLSLLSDYEDLNESPEGTLCSLDSTHKSSFEKADSEIHEINPEVLCLPKENLRNICLAFFLTIIGVFSMILTQWLHYKKVADGGNLITNLSWYLGQALVGCLPSIDPKKNEMFLQDSKAKKRTLNLLKGIGVLDFMCGILIIGGFFQMGSSLFQIVFSLNIPLTALVARILLKRQLVAVQWVAIFIIVLGFSANSILPYLLPQETLESSQLPSQIISKNNILAGTLMTIVGILIGSICGVITEKLIHKSYNPSPTMICQYIGIYSGSLCFVVQIMYVLPQRYSSMQEVLTDAFFNSGSQASKEATYYLLELTVGFGLLTVTHIFQHYANFLLIEAWGVVAIGIISALKSILVIIVSAAMFCSHDSKQCLTTETVSSAAIVTLGIVLYNLASLKKGKL
ncbi:hypothetical protein DSO57_1036472 [Entomophthora muscae]|uniref:Uncharacterized protein n=1 Tax=Entomophthora muscae TaxID=34485 RepID=A0ACC2U8L7_9FUNG|nr:hypothetical protein DSO57_1036472 [Entomophthora muscae]